MNLSIALDRAEIPVLLISGWQDIFLTQTLEQYRRLHERGVDVAHHHRSVVAPGGGGRRRPDHHRRDLRLDGGARRRRGHRRRVEPGAGVRDRRGRVARPAHLAARRPRRPPSTSRSHRDLSAEPPADDAPASSFLYDPAHPTPTVGGPLLGLRCVKDDTELADRADVACWTTDVLDEDLEVLGHPDRRAGPRAATTPTSTCSSGSPRSAPTGVRTTSPRGTDASIRTGPRARSPWSCGPWPTASWPAPVCACWWRVDPIPSSPATWAPATTRRPASSCRAARHTIHHGQGGCSRLVLPRSLGG